MAHECDFPNVVWIFEISGKGKLEHSSNYCMSDFKTKVNINHILANCFYSIMQFRIIFSMNYVEILLDGLFLKDCFPFFFRDKNS